MVTSELWSRGTLGIALRQVAPGILHAEAFYSLPLQKREDPLATPAWSERRVRLIAENEIREEDWLFAYRRQASPFPVGTRFLIDPREPEAGRSSAPSTDRLLLRLPARRAFGIGSHESTRLAVELLEERPPRNLRVLDVGTGTGILAFAALLLGASSVVAFDVDLGAALMARHNRLLNRLSVPLYAGRLGALSEAATFDLALVNMLLREILPKLPELVRLLKADGRLLLSGVLWEERSSLWRSLRRLGLAEEARRRDGDWVAWLVRWGKA